MVLYHNVFKPIAIIGYIKMYPMTTQNKRGRGKKNPPGQTAKEILRLIHPQKKGIAEGEIREKAKNELNVRDKTVIRNHLNTLEKKHLATHTNEPGMDNIWRSTVYENMNTCFEKCNIPVFTESQFKLIDFLIEYSDDFLSILTLKPDWCMYHSNILKVQKTFIPTGLEADNEILKNFDNAWFLILSKICTASDQMSGKIDIMNQKYIEEYKEALKNFMGKDYPDIDKDIIGILTIV